MRRALIVIAVLAVLAAACRKNEPAPAADASAASAAPVAKNVVAEPLPRCRADARELGIPGDEVVAGDAALLPDALLLGVVRRVGDKRVASIVRAPLDLSAVTVLDIGPARGDDPPPTPRVEGGDVVVAYYTRKDAAADAGPRGLGATRELRVARLDGGALGTVTQQADESMAFDLAWAGDGGAPLVAWDEDAPIAIGQFLPDRGTVKVQLLGSGAPPRAIVPYATDAEQPKLLARRGGFWLAWLARRGEEEEAGTARAPEGAGESRAFRWVELAPLDEKGERAGAIRRITPERGHIASFELVPGATDAEVFVLAHDEAAPGEGGGGRVVRYAIAAERVESAEVVDGGVGHASPDLVSPGGDAGTRWLSWSDAAERTRVLPLDGTLAPRAPATLERALDRARVVAARADALYAVASRTESAGAVVLRRLICR